MKNSEKILLALGAGLVTGALFGILFAPHKGSKTRKKIKEESKKAFEDVCQTFDEGLSKFNEFKNEFIPSQKE